jgi:hypothetical protein
MKQYIEVTEEEWLKAPQEKRRTRYRGENIEIKPLTGIRYGDGTYENYKPVIREYLIEKE